MLSVSLRIKFALVSLAFTIPIGSLLWLMVLEKEKAIQFAELEITGDRFLRPMRQLLEHVASHRIHSLKSAHGIDSTDKLASLKQMISNDMVQLEAVAEDLGPALQYTDDDLKRRKREQLSIASLRATWQSVLDESALTARDQHHSQMVATIRGIISHIGDTSNLILDPDLDSYYTMDVVLLALPQFQDRLQEVMAFLADLKPGKLNRNDETRLSVYQALLKTDVEHIAASVTTAISEDRNFFGTNQQMQSAAPRGLMMLLDTARLFIRDLAERTERGERPERSDRQGLDVSGTAALAASLIFWDTAVDILDGVIASRIQAFAASRTRALLVVFSCWAFAGGLAWYLQRSVTVPIRRIAAELTEIFEANLATSHTLHQTSQHSAGTASHQSAAIQETVAAMAEMSSMLGQTATHAQSASALAGSVSQQTVDGTKTMQNMAASMDTIAAANRRLKEITQIIEDISAKTNVINDIVFKTQLLSVNASIEAARAGQHGKGFAVVANEVSNLATMSGKAADEIRTLLKQSHDQVSQIVGATNESVKDGQAVSADALTTFATISKSVGIISERVSRIHEATREQDIGVHQTSESMAQMSLSTSDYSGVASENAVLAEDLRQQSVKLSRIGRVMNFVVFGTPARSKATALTAIDRLINGGEGLSENTTHQVDQPNPEFASIAEADAGLVQRIVLKAKHLSASQETQAGDDARTSSSDPRKSA